MASKRKPSNIVRKDQSPEELEAEQRQHAAARALRNVSASKLDLAIECLHWATLDLPEDKSGRAAATRGTPFHDGAATGVPGELANDHEEWLADELFRTWLEKGRRLLPSTYREEVAYCLHPDGTVTRIGENLGRDYGMHVGICGTIDVDGSASPESEVSDYKTGKRLKSAKDAWQLRFGNVVTESRKRSFHYLDEKGDVTPDSYECTAAEREDDRVRLVVLMSDITSGRTAPKPGEHCVSLYCPARKAKLCGAYEDHQKQKETPMGRMKLSNITSGRVDVPVTVLLYGVEGIGKSSFAADAPSPIFLDPDSGTKRLDVQRFPKPESWADCMEAIDELLNEKHDFKTFVTDTADALEAIAHAEVARKNSKRSIEDLGFGKGYVFALDLAKEYIAKLEALRAKGMNIITLAHAHVKRFDNPAGENYDRFQLKMHEKFAALLREWHEAVLFANYQTFIVGEKEEKRKKAVGDGSRMIFTQHRPAWSAKNRYGLPFELPLNWGEFAEAVKKGEPESPDELIKSIEVMLEGAPEELKAKGKDSLARCGKEVRKLASLADWLQGKLHAAPSASTSSTEAA